MAGSSENSGNVLGSKAFWTIFAELGVTVGVPSCLLLIRMAEGGVVGVIVGVAKVLVRPLAG